MSDFLRHMLRHLEPQCDVCTRSNVNEKITCEVYLSTPPVGYSGSLSTVNETNSTSNSTQTGPTTMCLKMNGIVFVDLDGDALQFVLLIRSVNDFSSRLRL